MAYLSQIKNDTTTYDIRASALPYATCATAAATKAKTATSDGKFTLTTGTTVQIKFTYSNTIADPTLNINSTGAKSIKIYGTTAPGTEEITSWPAGAVINFTYDGTNWVMNDYSSGSMVQIVRW